MHDLPALQSCKILTLGSSELQGSLGDSFFKGHRDPRLLGESRGSDSLLARTFVKTEFRPRFEFGLGCQARDLDFPTWFHVVPPTIKCWRTKLPGNAASLMMTFCDMTEPLKRMSNVAAPSRYRKRTGQRTQEQERKQAEIDKRKP
jgi:hypothetical protein